MTCSLTSPPNASVLYFFIVLMAISFSEELELELYRLQNLLESVYFSVIPNMEAPADSFCSIFCFMIYDAVDLITYGSLSLIFFDDLLLV